MAFDNRRKKYQKEHLELFFILLLLLFLERTYGIVNSYSWTIFTIGGEEMYFLMKSKWEIVYLFRALSSATFYYYYYMSSPLFKTYSII